MSTYSRARSKRQQRHVAPRCKSHNRDKQQGEARQGTRWVAVDAPVNPSPDRDFGRLESHEYIFDGKQWRRCEGPEEFADYSEDEAKFRSWYKKHTTRKGVVVEMKRPVETPIEVLTITFAPWLSDWVASVIAADHNPRPKLAAIRNQWVQAVQANLSGQRYFLGYAFHADTDDLHFDVVCSRQDGKGGRIGKAGLKLVGPHCVGIDRQLRAGACISEAKRGQMRRSVAAFRRRYQDEPSPKPLDVVFARALDAAADAVLGAELVPFREAYAARVPELERQHAKARLATLEAARSKLLRETTPSAPDISLDQ